MSTVGNYIFVVCDFSSKQRCALLLRRVFTSEDFGSGSIAGFYLITADKGFQTSAVGVRKWGAGQIFTLPNYKRITACH